MAKPTAQPGTDEAAEQAAEALETANADTVNIADTGAESTGGNFVHVFANLQSAQSFTLPDDTVVTVSGMPVSRLKDLSGNSIMGGKYGVTRVPEDQWAQVVKMYGKMRMFQSGLVFAAPSLERGKAMARERGGLRHGYEPVDPAGNEVKKSKKVKSTPKPAGRGSGEE